VPTFDCNRHCNWTASHAQHAFQSMSSPITAVHRCIRAFRFYSIIPYTNRIFALECGFTTIVFDVVDVLGVSTWNFKLPRGALSSTPTRGLPRPPNPILGHPFRTLAAAAISTSSKASRLPLLVRHDSGTATGGVGAWRRSCPY